MVVVNNLSNDEAAIIGLNIHFGHMRKIFASFIISHIEIQCRMNSKIRVFVKVLPPDARFEESKAI